MKTLLVVCALFAFAAHVHAQSQFQAFYQEAAPGDDPIASGTLDLTFEGDDNTITFTSNLFNVFDITGVHLHLEGNSSGGLFGGPLVLALTNTSDAPLTPPQATPLTQTGTKTSADLLANPQNTQVQARLTALGLTAAPPTRPAELALLIDLGLIYTDVHSVQRVSPDGVTRGRVRRVNSGGGYGTPPPGGYGYGGR